MIPTQCQLFNILGHGHGFLVVEALGKGPTSPCFLARRLNAKVSHVSKTLNLMLSWNLVTLEVHGRNRIYSLNYEKIRDSQHFLLSLSETTK